MILGFAGYLVFGLIVGVAYERITKIVPLFVVFYGLMLSSGNMGPGDMLGLLSSESYATGVRGTCYGISAALGKTGAAVGTQVFTPIEDNLGKRYVFRHWRQSCYEVLMVSQMDVHHCSNLRRGRDVGNLAFRSQRHRRRSRCGR